MTASWRSSSSNFCLFHVEHRSDFRVGKSICSTWNVGRNGITGRKGKVGPNGIAAQKLNKILCFVEVDRIRQFLAGFGLLYGFWCVLAVLCRFRFGVPGRENGPRSKVRVAPVVGAMTKIEIRMTIQFRNPNDESRRQADGVRTEMPGAGNWYVSPRIPPTYTVLEVPRRREWRPRGDMLSKRYEWFRNAYAWAS